MTQIKSASSVFICGTNPTLMRRIVAVILLVLILALALFAFNRYWTHRFDSLIARQAAIYRVDPDLVWSIIYEETYFSPWKTGQDGEIGLMQVTPTVGRESNLAGYQAVLDAAVAFDRAMPMMMTAAGTVRPAKVFVMGAGVAGLQAIATARLPSPI